MVSILSVRWIAGATQIFHRLTVGPSLLWSFGDVGLHAVSAAGLMVYVAGVVVRVFRALDRSGSRPSSVLDHLDLYISHLPELPAGSAPSDPTLD